MGQVVGTVWMRTEMRTEFRLDNLKQTHHLEDLGVEGVVPKGT
jgi:hypothetical protein